VAASQHDTRFEEDYRRAREAGILSTLS